ncbi:MAG: DUF1273 family protein [Clostridia bacterium]|nr:DUF1273 family protein [Clostridia bacterium]
MIKEKTCAVTGHRFNLSGLNLDKLKNEFINLIGAGYENFLIGMAIGFDTVCFQTLEELKKTYPNIKIIACVPCVKQYARFNQKQKEEYFRQIKNCDDVKILSSEYTPTCMFKRNKYMVDNSSVLIAFLNKKSGGTYNTVKYAVEKGIKIIYVK